MKKQKCPGRKAYPPADRAAEKEKNEVLKQKTYLGEILDFCTELGSRMIGSGANIERVSLAVETICHAYQLTDFSLFLLNSHMSLSARDKNGIYASRQKTVPSASIHLSRLKSLNRLSYRVAKEAPAPDRLSLLLEDAYARPPRSDLVTLLAQICAMDCLCLIFGGLWREIVCVTLITAMMHYIMVLLERPGFDRVVTITVTMWAAGAATVFLSFIGLCGNETVVLVTVCMLMIPGIPLVNAARNLMCGNEMNGILQMLKVTVEVVALSVGIFAAQRMFSRPMTAGIQALSPMTDPLLLILISFAASAAFGVVFRVDRHDLPLAGLGGALSRTALILLTSQIGHRLVYMILAALTASLYAEFLATKRRDPSTYFLYPSIIPLIPGDLFYYFIKGLILGEKEMILSNGVECLLALAGLSVGFVLSSIIAHYVRKVRFRRIKNTA